MSNSAIFLMGAAIPNLPFIAVAIAGLILAFSRRSIFPRGARWATVGFASLLLQTGLSLMDQYSAANYESSPENHAHNLVWMTSFMYLLRLVTLAALAIAVFADRPTSKPDLK